MSWVRGSLVVLGLSLLGIFLQGTLLAAVMPDFLVPNFVLILVVYLAFFEPTPKGAILSFFAGLLMDIASGLALGPWASAHVVVFALFASLSQRIFVESYLAGFLAVTVSAVIAGPIYAALHFGFEVPSEWTLRMAIGQGVVSGVLAPPAIALFKTMLRGKSGWGMSRGL